MSNVIRPGPQQGEEILTRERCFIREIINDPQVPHFSLALCRVLPGVTTELHRLSVDEWYLINAGHGHMEIDGQAGVPVGPGDTVVIPCGSAQRISNTGTAELRFQCVCLPRFTPDCYEPLE
ncbi:MAG: cupin domain-containing protein [Gammaproteobacteria bacterium]|nr:cupin domain-containing protein [Gammaproteobacteria bacterium]MDH4314049.1 cupin domain-containing protein [Gammaproteobacteria bacterium]MDH5213511.1 cupin domain-containing protein [Gammaproteobacteria bacterium]